MKGRTKTMLIVGGAILVAGAAFLAFAGQRYGPYLCSVCQIGAPMADPATVAYINELRAPAEIPFIDRTWVICNASHCADYTVNDSGDYEGSNRRRQESGGGTGGEGGGGGGGSGTGGAGSGGGGGGGTVIVKPIKKVEK